MESGISRRQFLESIGAASLSLALGNKEAFAQTPETKKSGEFSARDLQSIYELKAQSEHAKIEYQKRDVVSAEATLLMQVLTYYKMDPQKFTKEKLWDLLKRYVPSMPEQYSDPELVRVIISQLPSYFAKQGVVASTSLGTLSYTNADKVYAVYPEFDFFKVTSIAQRQYTANNERQVVPEVHATEIKFDNKSYLTNPLVDADGSGVTGARAIGQNMIIFDDVRATQEAGAKAEMDGIHNLASVTDEMIWRTIERAAPAEKHQEVLVGTNIRLRRTFIDKPIHSTEFFIEHELGHIERSKELSDKRHPVPTLPTEDYSKKSVVSEHQFMASSFEEVWGALGAIRFGEPKQRGVVEVLLTISNNKPQGPHLEAYKYVLHNITEEILKNQSSYGFVLSADSPLTPQEQVIWNLPELIKKPGALDVLAQKLWTQAQDKNAFDNFVRFKKGSAHTTEIKSPVSHQAHEESKSSQNDSPQEESSALPYLLPIGAAVGGGALLLRKLMKRREEVAKAEAKSAKPRTQKKKSPKK